MEEKLVKNQIEKAIAWSLAAEVIAKLLVPITNVILARILMPEIFGIVVSINMIISFADMLSTSGLSKYIIQHEFKSNKELNENANVIFWTNIIISLVAWVFIIIFRKSLSNMVGNSGYEMPLVIAAFSLPLTTFSSIQEAIFQRKLQYQMLFYRRIAVSILPFFVTIPLAFLGIEYWSLIIGTLASNILKILILYIASPWKPTFYYDFKKLKIMFSFCMWMLLSAILSWGITYIDVFLVSNKMGEFYTGLYKNSQILVTSIISIITSAITSVLFASLSREQDNNKNFSKLFFDFQKKVGMFVIPLGVGIFCFSKLITYILLGEQWLRASNFIGVFGFSTAMLCVFADFPKEACKAKGKPYIQFYVQGLFLILLIFMCLYGVEKGFDSLGIIRSLANFILIAIYMIFMKIFINISPLKMLWNERIVLTSAFIMGICAKTMLKYFPCNYIYQFIYIIVCIIIYFTLLYSSKEYRKEILQVIDAIKNRSK